ncbi:MAG: glycoside hydrolase family 3 C-terminal domain-containing protein [Bacillales bacterium]|nr:glycoside hydrolase family 3 C-terminal domain-containing protein [Bacillales bacterium]
MKKKLLMTAFLAGLMATGLFTSTNAANGYGRFDRFVADYLNRNEYIAAGSALNKQICEEGMVLLKNKDNVLPFDGVQKISVFGKSSTNLQYGGGGSGAGSNRGEVGVDLQQSLEAVGYEVNPSLTSFYKDNSKSGSGRKNGNSGWTGVSEATIGETPLANYDDELLASLDEYNDAAILLLARGGTEGADCKAIDARDFNKDDSAGIKADVWTNKHYLQLSDNETDLLNMIEEKFDKVVILINSGNIFQCDRFETDDKVSAVLWMGTPGAAGAAAVGRILKGEVCPSGRTVDTWARDFTKDPTFQNFADNAQTNVINGKEVPNDTMLKPDGSAVNSSSVAKWADEANKVVQGALNGVKPAAYISYEEGVYVDYRYYETRYADMKAENEQAAEDWYNGVEGVIYPFGYGLSYTSFTQEIVKVNKVVGSTLTKDDREIKITVKVTNTGNTAGKDVVQVYWKAPYYKGGIEKPYSVLAAFGKTNELAPGESEEVTCSFFLQDVASYDFDDKNNNDFKGYELDGGDYAVSINKNAHESYGEVKYKIGEEGIQYRTDRFTGHEVVNRFSGNDFFSSLPLENDVGFDQMSRADFVGTFPTHPTIADRTLKEGSRVEEFLTHEFTVADLDIHHNGYVSEAAYKSKADIEALGWTQQKTALAKENRMQLSEMIGVDLNDPKWDEFLNQFTYAELQKFVEDGTFHSPSLSAIGKPQTSDSDGPSQFAIIFWAGAPIVAATYNVDLARKQGEMVGTEAHINNKYGWFGPAVNTHRSPFGGRNFEYYSADPLLMGKIAANVVGAATEKGVYCYFKHFAVNDQEKAREGVSTFLTEQTLREIYLKSFQIVFQEGKSMGVMSSYNRLGNMETAASYPLLTEVLRGEWGFKGAVLSDMTHHGNNSFNHKCYENVNNRILSGCNAQLDNSQYTSDIECKWDNNAFNGKGAPVFVYNGEKVESYSWWYAVRTCAKEHLYMYARSGGMDQKLVARTYDVTVDGEEDGVLLGSLDTDFFSQVNLNDSVSVGGNFNDKIVERVDVIIDPLTPLPAGVLFEDLTITGTPTVAGEFKIRLIVNLTLNDQTTDTVARELVIKVKDPSLKDEDTMFDSVNSDTGKKKGCRGSIIATTSLIGTLSLALGGIYLSLKKKEETK